VTAQPCKHRDREPGPAAPPRRISGPPPGDDIAAGIASRAGGDLHGERLAYSADKAASLTGPSRDLLYEELRCNLAYVKVRRRCLITRQHLQQFLGIAS
jgi:hypothetical protein